MRTIAGCRFPETREESLTWQPDQRVEALHQKILVVAKTRIEGTWKAYIFPVAGRNHVIEATAWQDDGNPLPEEIARVIFPRWADIPYAR